MFVLQGANSRGIQFALHDRAVLLGKVLVDLEDPIEEGIQPSGIGEGKDEVVGVHVRENSTGPARPRRASPLLTILLVGAAIGGQQDRIGVPRAIANGIEGRKGPGASVLSPQRCQGNDAFMVIARSIPGSCPRA